MDKMWPWSLYLFPRQRTKTLLCRKIGFISNGRGKWKSPTVWERAFVSKSFVYKDSSTIWSGPTTFKCHSKTGPSRDPSLYVDAAKLDRVIKLCLDQKRKASALRTQYQMVSINDENFSMTGEYLDKEAVPPWPTRTPYKTTINDAFRECCKIEVGKINIFYFAKEKRIRLRAIVQYIL